mmetsp:Transcript_112877/g.319745  ORF Transcript_112877/g.319745 Transcript_112877/m.319745 type:complete len:379 (+) Transcript_112877:81-1217(+)
MFKLGLWAAHVAGGWQLAGGVTADPVQVELPMHSDSPGSLDDDLFFKMVGFTSTKVKNAHLNGHFAKLKNPAGRFSVSPPLPGGCGTLQYVSAAGKLHDPECLIAVNGGMFDVTSAQAQNGTYDCFGNLVSDGEIIQTRPYNISNVQFGIKNGNFVIGYITPEEAGTGEFEQLIEGLGWLVRDGANYIRDGDGWDEAYHGAGAGGDGYASGMSGRVGLGVTALGELVVLVVDGHTGPPSWGASMYELADKLIELGAVQAINLDGGGSTQISYRGVVVGYSSDRAAWGPLGSSYDPTCPIGNSSKNLSTFECLRRVSSFICIHEKASTGINWWLVAGGVAVVGALAAFFLMRRKGKKNKRSAGKRRKAVAESSSSSDEE